MSTVRSNGNKPAAFVRYAMCGGLLVVGLAAIPTASAQPGPVAAIAFPAMSVQVADEVSVPEPPVDPSFGVVVAPGVVPAPVGSVAEDEPAAVDQVAAPIATPAPVVAVVPVIVAEQVPDGLSDTGLAAWQVCTAGSLVLGGSYFAMRRMGRSQA